MASTSISTLTIKAVSASVGRFLVNGRKDRYRNGTDRYGTGKNILPLSSKRLPIIYRLLLLKDEREIFSNLGVTVTNGCRQK